MSDLLQVTTAAESRDEAVRLARAAVVARLAAGAQVVGPVVSLFWHLGESGEGEEWMVVLKTTTDRFAELEALLVAEHNWQNPEVSAVPLVAVSAPYGAWIRKTIQP